MDRRLPNAIGISFFLFPIAGCDLGPRHPPLESKRIVVEPAPGREPSRPRGMAFADLDGNGMPGIIVAEPDGPILAHRFPGWERMVVSPDHGGEALAAADMDGDGRQDVVSAGRSLTWYRNPGHPEAPFEAHVLRAAGPVRDLAAADVDGDGRTDILARDGYGSVLLLLQVRRGGWFEVRLEAGAPGTGLALADMDGDGRTDILGSGWYLSQGRSPASDRDWVRREVAAWPPMAAVAGMDMDRDGRMDLVLAAADQEHAVSWFRNPGPEGPAGEPWRGRVITRELGHVRRLETADLDRDGHADLVFAEQGRKPRSRIGVLVNPAGDAGNWRLRLLDDQGSTGLSIADVGRDGRLEILAVSPTGDVRIRLLTDLLQDADRVTFALQLQTRE